MEHKIKILVNDRPVEIAGHKVTGRHIKESAIEQGVSVPLDSTLAHQTDHGLRDIHDHEEIQLNDGEKFLTRSKGVEIEVNDHKVKIATHSASGRHIKQSAIEQGVSIQPDFILFKETKDGPCAVNDEENIHLHAEEKFSAHPREVEIIVNERKVKIAGHRAKGREIKQAAIAQQVPIQLDFVLSEELGDRRSRIIGDDDVVHLHNHSCFIAVAPDDNS